MVKVFLLMIYFAFEDIYSINKTFLPEMYLFFMMKKLVYTIHEISYIYFVFVNKSLKIINSFRKRQSIK